jgi:hypothetical protein
MSREPNIGLLAARWSAQIDMLVAVSGLPFAEADVSHLRLPAVTNGYGLPRIREGDVLVVTSGWLKEVASRSSGTDLVTDVLVPLRERFGRIVGVDHADPFSLDVDERTVASLYREIAEQGYEDWRSWSKDPTSILRQGYQTLCSPA